MGQGQPLPGDRFQHTINLQEQLIGKDLPQLIEQAGMEFSSALVKGRGNYLCQRKAAQVEPSRSSWSRTTSAENSRTSWLGRKRPTTAALADLTVRPRPAVWEQVVSESDNCLRARCPFYSKCFFYNARRRAAAADVLVVNHHLLLTDLALRDETENPNPERRPAAGRTSHHRRGPPSGGCRHQSLRLPPSLTALERVLSRLQARRNRARGILPSLAMALDSSRTSRATPAPGSTSD